MKQYPTKLICVLFLFCGSFDLLANETSPTNDKEMTDSLKWEEGTEQNSLKTKGPNPPKPENSTRLTGSLYEQLRNKKIPEDSRIGAISDGLWIGGLIRFRPEFKHNYDFNKSTNDNVDFTGQKIQFFIQKDFTQDISARITFQDTRIWGSETGSATGLNTANDFTTQGTDVREAFFEVKELGFQNLTLQMGRQILIYGDQRLVGSLDWTNVGRSFDGARFKWEDKYLSSHLWVMSIGENNSDIAGNNSSLQRRNNFNAQFNCPPNGKSGCNLEIQNPGQRLGDSYFTGFYNTVKPTEDFHIDLYYLGLQKEFQQQNSAFLNQTKSLNTPETRAGRQDILHTFGIRFTNKTHKGKSKSAFDYSFEYVAQRGINGKNIRPGWDVLNTQVDAYDPVLQETYRKPFYREKVKYDTYAYAADVGYKIDSVRLGAGYDLGSGDPDRTDGSIGTFQNLFHTNHIWYGLADQVSWVNMVARSVNLTYFFKNQSFFRMDYFIVDKHRSQDGWYEVSGALKQGASTESLGNNRYDLTGVGTEEGTGNNRAVGYLGRNLFREVDFRYTFNYKNINWDLGYSLIFVGDSIRNKVDDNTIGFPYNGRRNFSGQASFAYLMMSYVF